jgi:FkbM family methyltransferase
MPHAELLAAAQQLGAADPDRAGRIARFLSRRPGICGVTVTDEPAGTPRATVWFVATPDGLPRRRLPDGTVVAELNGYETEHLYQEIVVNRAYTPPDLVLRPGAVIVDIGANIGMFTLALSRAVPDCRLLALEPDPDAYAALLTNTAAIASPVTCRPWAVGITSGRATMTVYPSASSRSGLFADPATDRDAIRAAVEAAVDDTVGAEVVENLAADRVRDPARIPVEVRSLPEVLGVLGNGRVDLLKLDIGGGELAALRQLRRPDWDAIRQFVVAVRVGSDPGAVLDLLDAKGFDVTAFRVPALDGCCCTHLYARRRNDVRPPVTHPAGQPESVPALPALERTRRALAAFLSVDAGADASLDAGARPVDVVEGTGPPPPDPEPHRISLRRTPIEVLMTVTAAWREALDTVRVQPGDDFFECGGSSVLAVRMVARLRGRHGYRVELDEFLRDPSFDTLVSLCATGAGGVPISR